MKIAIAKPDFGITGGFEIVVQRVADGLRARGHLVDLVGVDVTHNPDPDVAVGAAQLALFGEFFRYLNIVADFERLDVSGYEVVLCAQPGSHAVSHPHKVVLFYHHQRSFYDLQEVVERVRERDTELHRLTSWIVHDVDACFLTADIPILAGSRRVKQRLAEHNGLTENVEVFSAGISEIFLEFDGPTTFEYPLCVGRHEFPKRTELFIHAMHHVSGLQGCVFGRGSYTERLKALDSWLRLQHLDGAAVPPDDPNGCLVDDHRLWLHDVMHKPLEDFRRSHTAPANGSAHVRFRSSDSVHDLLNEYAAALCVVCPAFDEDYGLTCLEAMACGKPVIACHDGGGYVELINDGVDGLLVEPNGPAIAAAVDQLRDVTRAREMGARGREKAGAYTWARAIAQVDRALLRAVSKRT